MNFGILNYRKSMYSEFSKIEFLSFFFKKNLTRRVLKFIAWERNKYNVMFKSHSIMHNTL